MKTSHLEIKTSSWTQTNLVCKPKGWMLR